MRTTLYITAVILLSFSLSSYATPFDCEFFESSLYTTTVPNNGEVFTIDTPCNPEIGNVVNQGQLTNNAGIQLYEPSRRFSNFGTYNNNGDTALINADFKNGPSGTVNNQGTFFLGDRELLVNEGLFRNDGQVEFRIGGAVFNSGTWINSAGANIDFSTGGDITNSGDFRVEAGATVSSINGFEIGSFVQNSGTTLLDGDFSASGMDIDGGKLVGSGSFTNEFATEDPDGLTVKNGTFEVGSNGVGQFDVTSKFACLTCTMLFDVVNPGKGPSDFLNIMANRPTNGTAVFDDVFFEFNLLDGYYGATGDLIDLVSADGGFDLAGISTNFGHIVVNGDRLSLRVPEPGSLALLGLGVLALLRRAHRKHW